MDSTEACCKCGQSMDCPTRFPWVLSCNHYMCLECIGPFRQNAEPQQAEFPVVCAVCTQDRDVNLVQFDTQINAVKMMIDMQKMKVGTGQTTMGHQFVCSKHKNQPICCYQKEDAFHLKLMCQKCLFEEKVNLKDCHEIDEDGLKDIVK